MDGADAIVEGTDAVGRCGLMGLVPIGSRRRWVPSDAVDGDSAGAVSCKRSLSQIITSVFIVFLPLGFFLYWNLKRRKQLEFFTNAF